MPRSTCALDHGVNLHRHRRDVPDHPARAPRPPARPSASSAHWIARSGRRGDIVLATKIVGAGNATVGRDGAPIAPETLRDRARGQPAAAPDRLRRPLPAALAEPRQLPLPPELELRPQRPAPRRGASACTRSSRRSARSWPRARSAPSASRTTPPGAPPSSSSSPRRTACRASPRSRTSTPAAAALRPRPRRALPPRGRRPARLLAARRRPPDRQVRRRRPAARLARHDQPDAARPHQHRIPEPAVDRLRGARPRRTASTRRRWRSPSSPRGPFMGSVILGATSLGAARDRPRRRRAHAVARRSSPASPRSTAATRCRCDRRPGRGAQWSPSRPCTRNTASDRSDRSKHAYAMGVNA